MTCVWRRQKKLQLPVTTVDELKQYVCVHKPEDLTAALENFFIFAPSFASVPCVCVCACVRVCVYACVRVCV